MTCLFALREYRLLLCLLFFASLIGCSKQGDSTATMDKTPVKASRDANEQPVGGGTPMGKWPKHGFEEYVKQPSLFQEEAREMEQADSAPPPTDRELAALVSAMSKRRLEYKELQKLKKAGDKIVPLLLNAMRDEQFLFHRYGKSVLDGSSIKTSLDLLEPFSLPKASVLEPALRHPDEWIRREALYHLGRCGNDDAIEALEAGLKDGSKWCRRGTLSGLECLNNSPRGSKQFRGALFDAVVPLLGDKEFDVAAEAPRTVLALDLERGKRILLGKDVFHSENRRIDDILKAFKDMEVPVPGPQLRSLLAGIKNKAKDFPFDWAYADGLILLARAEGTRAKDLIDDAQDWGDERVKEGAATATEIAAGITNAFGFVYAIYERKGIKGLSKPQLYYFVLWELDAEVRNGGFSQYYFNSSGELAIYAVEAAEAVGASKLAGIIQKANDLFGKKGPDADRIKRMEQLSKVELKVLEALDSQYYKCSERLSELLPRFAASHAEVFKPAK